MNRPRTMKPLAATLALSVLLTAPGLAPYSALAQTLEAPAAEAVAPGALQIAPVAALPSSPAPLSNLAFPGLNALQPLGGLSSLGLSGASSASPARLLPSSGSRSSSPSSERAVSTPASSLKVRPVGTAARLSAGTAEAQALLPLASPTSSASPETAHGSIGRSFDLAPERRAGPVLQPEATALGSLRPAVSDPVSGLNAKEAGRDPIAGLRSVKEKLAALPKSFLWGFVPGLTLSYMGQEILSVALPVYTADLFGLPQALIATGLGYMMRIPGAWATAWFAKRYNPKVIGNVALAIRAASGWMIPLAVMGHLTTGLYGVFLLNSALSGLVYGANQGITEKLLPPLIIGRGSPAKKEQLNLGLNYAYQWVELSCLAMAFVVAVPLLNVVGGTAMMGIASSLIGISTLFYGLTKFVEPWKKPEAEKAAAPAADASRHDLEWKAFLPYVFFRFMHFALYGVLGTAYALSTFGQKAMAGNIIGGYDLGAWLSGLLITVALLPKLGRKGWTVAGAATAVLFVWSSFFFRAPLLTIFLAGALGGLINVVTNEWDSYYQNTLPQSRLANFSKRMLTYGMLAVLPIFAAVSASRALPAFAAHLSIPNILLGVNVAVTAAAALVLYFAYKRFKGESPQGRGPPYDAAPLKGKTILIVGSYLPLRSFIFEAAVKAGVDIVLVDDPSRKEQALKYVKPENFIPAPVMDADKHDEVLAAVEAFMERRKASGQPPIEATQTFLDAFTVLNAKIAEKGGFRSHGLAPIVDTKVKDRMRAIFSAHPQLRIGTRMVSSADDAARAFRDFGRGVIKPPRGASSQFVAEVRSEEEARAQFNTMTQALSKMQSENGAAAKRYSLETSFRGFLYEEYLDGQEVDIEIIVQDGAIKFMVVTDNLETKPPYFVEEGDTYPSQLPPEQIAALKAMAAEAVRVIGHKNGNIHLEAKMTSKGPKVVEINSRMGGDFVYHAIKEAWGVDLVELGLMAASGVPIPDMTGLALSRVVVAREWPTPVSGIITGFSPETLDMVANPKKYGLSRVELLKKVGDKVLAPPDSMGDRPAYVLASGATYEEALRNAEAAFARIKVGIQPLKKD